MHLVKKARSRGAPIGRNCDHLSARKRARLEQSRFFSTLASHEGPSCSLSPSPPQTSSTSLTRFFFFSLFFPSFRSPSPPRSAYTATRARRVRGGTAAADALTAASGGKMAEQQQQQQQQQQLLQPTQPQPILRAPSKRRVHRVASAEQMLLLAEDLIRRRWLQLCPEKKLIEQGL